MAVKQRTGCLILQRWGHYHFRSFIVTFAILVFPLFLVHTVGSLALLHASVEVPIGLAVHVPLVLLLIHVVVAHVAVVLATLAILELIQYATHLQQAHPLLGLAHGSTVQARCRVESAVGVPIALGISLESSEPIRLGISGHLCHCVVARDSELGGLGAVRVGQRAEVGAVAAGHEVLGNHVGALGGSVDGDGGGPIDTTDPAHSSSLRVRGVEVHVGDEAGEGSAANRVKSANVNPK